LGYNIIFIVEDGLVGLPVIKRNAMDTASSWCTIHCICYVLSRDCISSLM